MVLIIESSSSAASHHPHIFSTGFNVALEDDIIAYDDFSLSLSVCSIFTVREFHPFVVFMFHSTALFRFEMNSNILLTLSDAAPLAVYV